MMMLSFSPTHTYAQVKPFQWHLPPQKKWVFSLQKRKNESETPAAWPQPSQAPGWKIASPLLPKALPVMLSLQDHDRDNALRIAPLGG